MFVLGCTRLDRLGPGFGTEDRSGCGVDTINVRAGRSEGGGLEADREVGKESTGMGTICLSFPSAIS